MEALSSYLDWRLPQIEDLKAAVLLADQGDFASGRIGAYQDTRELVVHKNYIVTYRMRGDELEVLQVWHVARDIRRGGHR